MEAMESDEREDCLAETFRHFRNSRQTDHQHLCAVIAALQEVIKEQGLQPSGTAYFAAIMASLESQRGQASGEVTAATCSLLATVLPKVPSTVLRSKADVATQLILELLLSVDRTKEEEAGGAGTSKGCLRCLHHLLKAAEKTNWPKLARPFGALLQHAVDARPKVRKLAHACIIELMADFRGTPAHAPASDAVVSVAERLMSVAVNPASSNPTPAKKGSPAASTVAATEALYFLTLLRQLLPVMTGRSAGRLGHRLAELHALRQPLLTRHVISALQGLCQPSTAPDDKEGLTASALGEAVGKILEQEQAVSGSDRRDLESTMAAVRLTQQAFLRLHEMDPSVCAKKLPLAFLALTPNLASEHEELVFGTAECLRALLRDCIDEPMIRQGISVQGTARELRKGGLTPIERVSACLETLLGYQYSTAWDMSLLIVSEAFQSFGEASLHLLPSLVKTLGDLQDLPEQDMPYQTQLSAALGAAVEAMGPQGVLSLLPLEMDVEDLSKSRAWLLPILQKYIVGAPLMHFLQEMLPLAGRLQQRVKKCEQEGRPIAARNAETCMQQVWALLPSFCNFASDTASSFRLLAKDMGGALNSLPELRGSICSALQILIKQNKAARGGALGGDDQVVTPSVARARAKYTPEVGSANLIAITAYAKNFLPLLFNLFVAAPPEKRVHLFATIEEFASVGDKAQVKGFAEGMMKRLLHATKEAIEGGGDEIDRGGETATSRRCTFMELALALAPGMDDEGALALYRAAKPAILESDATVQKKAYRLIARLLELRPSLLEAQGEDLLEVLLATLATCASPAKRPRLRCLQQAIQYLSRKEDATRDGAIATLLSEIILAAKETNSRTRSAAYDLLVTIARTVEDPEKGGSPEALVRYFGVVVGGLAGRTPHMLSATVMALARLLYEFSSTLVHLVPELMPTALLLLRSKSREVIKALLGFVKVVVARLPGEELEPYLKDIVEGLLTWSGDTKNHFKAKVKAILERLVRRVGLEAVTAVTPEEHQKLIANIRKTKARQDRKRRESEAGSQAGSQDHADEARSALTRASTARASAWSHGDVFSDSDSEGEAREGRTTLSKVGTTASRAARKARRLHARLMEDTYGDSDGEGEPLDLLDAQRTRKALSKKGKGKGNPEEPGEFEMFDGKLLIKEESRGKKRDRGGDEDVVSVGAKSSKQGGAKEKKARKGNAMTGYEYAPRKGVSGGDAKRAGKLEPFAYWPLDPKMMNRREGKRAQARRGMSTVLKSNKKSRVGVAGGGVNKGNRRKVHKGKGKGRAKS